VSVTTARLLVVEDDQDTLDLFALWLGEKYRVFSYRCAAEALAALEAAKPDLLLLDIGMRPIDGLECLKAIRATPGYNTIPAIALTGYARDCERAAFQAAGFEAVLTKPILDNDLFAAIAAMFAQLGDRGSVQSPVTTAA
jgi:two-component system CheB/CheR fusion protein